MPAAPLDTNDLARTRQEVTRPLKTGTSGPASGPLPAALPGGGPASNGFSDEKGRLDDDCPVTTPARAGGTAPAGAATSLPCDIYATAGTPCVAAHSTTRALYAAYNGPLYQVRRASNGATTNIGTLTTGVATGSQPQGAYMVASGTHVNSGCCFDYGNAETNNRDNGNGHMDAVYFGTLCWFGPCNGFGPWVQADLENGLFSGGSGSNTRNAGNKSAFVTALVKNNGTTTYAIKGGNADSGGLTTWYSGSLPTTSGYMPMHAEGAIILGVGGDNSNSSAGSFFEGVMTAGYPTDAADTSVQANIVSVGYAAASGGSGATGTIVAGVNSAKCVDDNNGSGTPGTKVQMWDCDGNTAAQNWTVNSNGTLTIAGGCMDITSAKSANGTLIELWTCNGGANQQWQAQSGELVNPTTGKCLDDPGSNTTNGTQLVLWTCNGGANQHWTLP